MEYKYFVVNDVTSGTDGYELSGYLSDGYTIKRATATSSGVHYILSRAEKKKPNDVTDIPL